MAEKFRFVATKAARLLYSSITQKSAPRGVQGAVPKFSGTFGMEEVDFKLMVPLMVEAIKSECGAFSGNPEEYFLACMSGKMSAARTRAKAKLDAMGKGEDEAFKIMEKAEKRAAIAEQYAGVLTASSQFDVELARLEAGKIIDIKEEHLIAAAGKELFYPGAYVVPSVALQGFRRKSLDAKDGCTAFLQNVLFIRKGEKIDTGGGANNQEVFGGFAGYSDFDPTALAPGGDSSGFGDYQPSGGSDVPPSEAGGNPPPPPTSGPQRPANPAHIHNNGDGTEQYWTGTAWDGGKHPAPGATPPPPATGAAAGTFAGF